MLFEFPISLFFIEFLLYYIGKDKNGAYTTCGLETWLLPWTLLAWSDFCCFFLFCAKIMYGILYYHTCKYAMFDAVFQAVAFYNGILVAIF